MRHATPRSGLSTCALGLSPALFALTAAWVTFGCSTPVDFGERADGGTGGSGGSAAESSGGHAAVNGNDGSPAGEASGGHVGTCIDGCPAGAAAEPNGTGGSPASTGGAETGAVGGQVSTGGSSGTAATGGAVGGGPADTGGTGNVGGAGAPATPAAVGLSLTLSQPDPDLPSLGSRVCTAGTTGSYTYAIGAPAPGRTIESGTNGVDVSCIVLSDGVFTAAGGGVDANGHKPISFGFGGVVHNKTNAAENPGSMTFFSPDTLSLMTLDGFPGCTVGPVATLKSGAILTDIDCPLIASVDDTTSGCKVHGTIAFEYCTGYPNCGNGIVEAGENLEECDQGAANSDDAYGGCSTQCQIGPHCGDGIINGPEECDEADGNGAPGGDCTSGCRIAS